MDRLKKAFEFYEQSRSKGLI